MKNPILVVENDKLLVKTWHRISETMELDIFVATSGAQCLGWLEVISPGIILLDYLLPGEKGMDGLAVCKKLKSMPRYRDIPIIILSGYDRDEERQKALEARAEKFIGKPFRLEALFEAIASLESRK